MKKIPLKRIMKYMKPHMPYLVLSLVCSLIYALSALFVPVMVGESIDLFIGKKQVDFNRLWSILGVISGLAAAAGISQYVQGVSNNRLAFMTIMDIRNAVIDKLQKLPLAYFDAKPSGEIVNSVVADAESLSDGIVLAFTQFFTGIVTIAGTLVLMFVYNPLIALIVVGLTPMSLFAAKYFSSRTHAKFALQAKLRADETSFIEETVYNNKTVKAYGRERAMEEKFEIIDENLRKTALDATFYSSLTNPVTRFINAVVYAAVALVGGLSAAGIITFGGTITAGVLTCLLNYAGQYAKPFNEISGVITELQASAVGANRIFSLLDAEEEPSDKNGKIISGPGNVELDNVCFSYDKSRELIKNLSLKVEPGKHVAIVGPTGCGKTTLINLLMRFYDVDSGAVIINGTDVKEGTRHSLRDNWGMVLQESWIRKTSVRENLTLGSDIDDNRILEAARLCKADGFIARLGGLDTEISDDSLSQGERQLLCITRVMLSNPGMLILDEATSAVDVRTEVKVSGAFDLLMRGKTSFIVAHRLSTIRNADMIIVMRDGNVVDKGTHKELLGKGGFYSDLYYGLVE